MYNDNATNPTHTQHQSLAPRPPYHDQTELFLAHDRSYGEQGTSLREIAEEVDATPGAITASPFEAERHQKAPPSWPRARRGASPPASQGREGTQGQERAPARLKAAKAPKAKTFPRRSPEVIEGEFRFVGYDVSPRAGGDQSTGDLPFIGLISTDNLSDDADCSDDIDSDATPSVQVDADSLVRDDNGDCDGSVDTDDGCPLVR